MKSRFSIAAALLLCAAAAFANPPRITFMRTMAPAHDLAPAESLAVIYAMGDSNKIETFVEHFVDLVSRAGLLRIANAVENNHHMLVDELALRTVRREHPADAYLGINRFTCDGDGEKRRRKRISRQRRSREADASLDRRRLLGAHRRAECRGKEDSVVHGARRGNVAASGVAVRG